MLFKREEFVREFVLKTVTSKNCRKQTNRPVLQKRHQIKTIGFLSRYAFLYTADEAKFSIKYQKHQLNINNQFLSCLAARENWQRVSKV